MELVYLWVEDYKNIKNQGFNFSSRFRCNYDIDKNELTIDENRDYFHIFPENINVTAIVGKNGSGKSSILELIYLQNKKRIDTKKIKCLFVYYNKNTGLSYISGSIKLNNISEANEFKLDTFNYINISNYINDIFDIKDIITINNCIFNTETSSSITSSPILSNTQLKEHHECFKSYQVLYLLYFLENKKNINLLKRFNFPAPAYFSISINSKFRPGIKKLINQLEAIHNCKYTDYRTDEDIEQYIDEHKDNDLDLKTRLMVYNELIQQSIAKENKIIISIQYFELIKQFIEIYDFDNDDFIYSFCNESKEEIYFSSGEQTIFFLLINPKLLSMKQATFNNYLIIDEIDLYLHPNIQKKIFSILLEKIKIDTNDSKDNFLNIYITSHSPLIISDIPKENVIFLENGKQKYPFKDSEQTFGANIHTLLSHGFFMEDGLIGEFAKEKIQSVINFLNNKESKIKSKEEAKKIIQIIGEPFLKYKLEEKFHENYSSDKVKNEAKIKRLEEEIERLKSVKSKD